MGSTQFGNFENFCRDSTLPICNVLSGNGGQNGAWQGCELKGISLSNNQHLGNLGSILLSGIAIILTGFLFFKSQQKKAAVGRREMQLFLIGYMVISLCQIFTIGDFPLDGKIRIAFSAIHLGFIVATTWVLMLNAVVGYQIIDDGTPLSVGLMFLSAAALLVGTGYITLDTGYNWTGYWESSHEAPFRNIALYVLYQGLPLIFLVAFFALETILVLRILGEVRPMLYLAAATILFALGQIFNYVISSYICNGTSGAIDGNFFETFFTLTAVVMIWVFWSSITEDDWPVAPPTTSYP